MLHYKYLCLCLDSKKVNENADTVKSKVLCLASSAHMNDTK